MELYYIRVRKEQETKKTAGYVIIKVYGMPVGASWAKRHEVSREGSGPGDKRRQALHTEQQPSFPGPSRKGRSAEAYILGVYRVTVIFIIYGVVARNVKCSGDFLGVLEAEISRL